MDSGAAQHEFLTKIKTILMRIKTDVDQFLKYYYYCQYLCMNFYNFYSSLFCDSINKE